MVADSRVRNKKTIGSPDGFPFTPPFVENQPGSLSKTTGRDLLRQLKMLGYYNHFSPPLSISKCSFWQAELFSFRGIDHIGRRS
jgi:hypothetical protein